MLETILKLFYWKRYLQFFTSFYKEFFIGLFEGGFFIIFVLWIIFQLFISLKLNMSNVFIYSYVWLSCLIFVSLTVIFIYYQVLFFKSESNIVILNLIKETFKKVKIDTSLFEEKIKKLKFAYELSNRKYILLHWKKFLKNIIKKDENIFIFKYTN